jgi:uncharacterized DUF497 family protein
MMKIEFDPSKRDKTLIERGVDMARADEVLTGKTITQPDDRKDYGEDRWISIGFLDGRMVVLAWTKRQNRYRIISMRKANEREQNHYGIQLGGP